MHALRGAPAFVHVAPIVAVLVTGGVLEEHPHEPHSTSLRPAIVDLDGSLAECLLGDLGGMAGCPKASEPIGDAHRVHSGDDIAEEPSERDGVGVDAAGEVAPLAVADPAQLHIVAAVEAVDVHVAGPLAQLAGNLIEGGGGSGSFCMWWWGCIARTHAKIGPARLS